MLEGHNGIVATEEAMCSGTGLREEQGVGGWSWEERRWYKRASHM